MIGELYFAICKSATSVMWNVCTSSINFNTRDLLDRSPVRGGGTPLYKPYRYVLPETAWYLSHFIGLK